MDSGSHSSAPAGPASSGAQRHLIDGLALPAWLPCDLTLELAASHFTVRDLLNLRVGSIVETPCHHTRDVPLRANAQLIGWTEFEVIGDRLAVRITELA